MKKKSDRECEWQKTFKVRRKRTQKILMSIQPGAAEGRASYL